MANQVAPIPADHPRVTPGLIVQDAAKALEFYVAVFGATEQLRVPGPEGKIIHARIKIGESPIMLSDELPEMGTRAPPTVGGSPCFLYVFVENVDEVVEKAVKLGAKLQQPVADAFYGDRLGHLEDPFGHVWTVATRVEDLSPEDFAERAAALMQED